MEMKKFNSGRLRAICYDARARMLQYGGVGEDTWRRLSNSGAAWSLYRDNIEVRYNRQRLHQTLSKVMNQR